MKTKICFIAFQFLHINTNINYNVGALRPLLIELLAFCRFCVNAPFIDHLAEQLLSKQLSKKMQSFLTTLK